MIWMIATPPRALTRTVRFVFVFIGLAAVCFAQEPSSSALTTTLFDTARVQTGEFHYRIVKAGKEISRSVCVSRKQADANFRFAAEFDGFNQQWLSIATHAFAPVEAQLRTDRANGGKYAMHVVYHKGRARASVRRWTLETRSAPPSKTVTAHVPPGTIDQRIDWAAVLSSPAAGTAI